MSTFRKYYLKDVCRLYFKGALYDTYEAQPKTRVEMRLIEASALIRSSPNWADQLRDEDKCEEWITQVKDAFKLTDKEVDYVFSELDHYAQLKAGGCDGEEAGGVDMVWIYDAASDCELANEFKEKAARLASDHAAALLSSEDSKPHAVAQVMVDPFMYPFSSTASRSLDRPITSPEAALDFMRPEVETESLITGLQELDVAKESGASDLANTSVISNPVTTSRMLQTEEEHTTWLPTNFIVNDEGSVSIRSYINNLHPTRYTELYQSISKVFAKFVPLLEQVTTDLVRPRDMRAKFYNKASATYTEPEPVPFGVDRDIVPYNMRGMTLQASVEMTNIDLTPDRPTRAEGRWQAMGRDHERIFAVGLYFYEMENIACARLKMRDPVVGRAFKSQEEKDQFCKAHNVTDNDETGCMFSQEFEGIEIKAGRYICYPNLYQVKMPSFTLADPTKPGSVKCIAFYIVDPTEKVTSTDIVPPRDPSWAKTGEPATSALVDSAARAAYKLECTKRDFLRRKHAKKNEKVGYRFEVPLQVDYMYD
ncbi:hypothetical protein GGI19_006524 [Coemansia pectinata]|uniref:DUF4246 domain-containing protein n=1 Tax=Coemansia pectinata TaxID=1052879 RepID=A0A9W8L8J2_9FUNG|nr:hypothetical protein GGI19_006524 [Coemansia pectinata]